MCKSRLAEIIDLYVLEMLTFLPVFLLTFCKQFRAGGSADDILQLSSQIKYVRWQFSKDIRNGGTKIRNPNHRHYRSSSTARTPVLNKHLTPLRSALSLHTKYLLPCDGDVLKQHQPRIGRCIKECIRIITYILFPDLFLSVSYNS